MSTASQRRARRSRRRNTASDLGARVWVAIPAIAFAIFIVAAGGAIFAAGAVLLGLICLHELFRMYEALRPVRLAGFLGLIGLAAAAHFGGEHQVLLATVAFFPLLFLIALALPERAEVPLTDSMALTLLGTLWIGLAIAHAVLLRELPHGDAIVIDVLVGTFIGDTAAYLGGRTFGTRPLARRISPNKTLEGLGFGIAGATVAVWCAGLYQDWLGGWNALLLGVVVGLAAPLGDLFESKVKRDAGTKDAGTLFGPHGGALDRLDAALFSLVAGYYMWLLLL
jgi:phosphatidate cytidylyltransferase